MVLQSRCQRTFSSEEGNQYEPCETASGVKTFRHVATGEILHGQVGPWKEAWTLYVEPSGLPRARGNVVVYDLGLGCGAQLLAAFEAFFANTALTRLDVVSFDLEKSGLELLRSQLDDHPYAAPHAALLDAMISRDMVETRSPDGRLATWRFVAGDYRDTIRAPEAGGAWDLPLADVIFFDFFSPSSHPWLWHLEAMRNLRARSSERACLYSYTSATRGRATMAAAGFFLGLGEPSGMKKNSTIAACRIEDLTSPLPARWRDTFLTSQAAYLDDEPEAARIEIREAILSHPQFREG